jgi:diadenosine tetraphosphate (Ap4A) HIT family hydrolase
MSDEHLTMNHEQMAAAWCYMVGALEHLDDFENLNPETVLHALDMAAKYGKSQ